MNQFESIATEVNRTTDGPQPTQWMDVRYLDYTPTKGTTVGLVKVTIGAETRLGMVLLNHNHRLTLAWPHSWPSAIWQHLDEVAILNTWIDARKFHVWAATSFNVWS